MATIKQIASLAGVSRGTVDRVLNGRGIVNSATAAKVREIADAVKYTPNKAGKTLAICKKSLKLGYILFNSTTSNPFFEDVVAGIEAKALELQEYGINVKICYSDLFSAARQVALMDELVADGINGLAITPINHPEVAGKIQELMNNGIPVVTVNTDIANSGRLAYVGSNYYESGKTAGGLMALITGGSAVVGVVTGSSSVLCHSERVAGFRRHIAKHQPGMSIVEVVENHDDDFESFAATKALLEAHSEINALYLAAAGVYGAGRAIMSAGLAGKLKVISFDTVPTTKKLLKDGLIAATIDQQPFKQGTKPLDILTDFLTLGTLPEQDCFYTTIEIKIKENI